MPNNVVREFVIKVNSDGQIEAIRDYKKLDETLKSTATTAGQTDRAMKGVAGATSNSTKEFAKQAQGLGGIVRIYATVAANVFALSSAYLVLKRNADLEILRTSSEQLSIATGQNFATVADSIKGVTGSALTFSEAMQSANLALSGGLSGKQATQIAEIATKAANALGRSVPEAVQRLTQAIVKAEPELADEFGIILRVTKATNDYAKAIGKLPTELSTAQKLQAIFNEFLEQGTDKFANVQIQTNPYDKLAASFTELATKLIEIVRVPIDPFIKLISSSGIILLGIFGAIAAKLTSLAIPALNQFTQALAENSASYSVKAQQDYVAAQERLINANLAAADSFEDYKKTLAFSLRDIDLTKLNKSKGFDPEQLLGENLEEDLIGYFQKAGKGIDSELDSLRERISKKLTGAVTGSIIDIDGLKLSTTKARVLMEALSISTKEGRLEAERFFQTQEGAVRSLGSEIEVTKAKIVSFSAQLKAATAGQFSLGLTGGFIDNLKELPILFNDNIKAVQGFGYKFAGSIGLGARSLGILVGGVSKLLAVLGPLGLALSFAVSLFGEFTDLLGITSESARKASDSLDKLTEKQKVLSKQVEFNKNISSNSFEGYARQAEHAANLTNGFLESLQDVTNALENLQRANEESFFARLFGQRGDIEQSISTVIDNIKLQAESVPQGFRDEFLKAAQSIEVDLRKASGIQFQGTELRQLQEELKGLDFVNFSERFGTVDQITFKADLTDANKKQLIDTVQKIFDSNKAEKLIQAFNNGLLQAAENGNLVLKDINSRINTAINGLRDFSDFADKEARKLERSNPVIQQLDSLLTSIETQREGLNTALAEKALVTPEAQALLDIDETQAKDFDAIEVAASSLRDTILEIESAIEVAKESQKTYNSELKIASQAISKGSIEAVNNEYKARRDILDAELVIIDKQIQALEIRKQQQDRLGSSQLNVTNAQLEALAAQKIAKEEESKLYSETNAKQKISIDISKLNEQAQARILSTVQSQARVYDRIASVTGNTQDLQIRLAFEEKILKAKINQLNAAARAKVVEASSASGAKRNQLLAEAGALRQQVDIEKELAAINNSVGQRDIALAQLELENKVSAQIYDTKAKSLEIEQDLANIRSSNLFLSNEARDAAELLSIQKELEIIENNRAIINTDISLLQSKIAEEVANIARLQLAGFAVGENNKAIQELQLELIKKENEARGLSVDKAKALTAQMEEQFELAKKNADLFNRPEEFQNLLGENFRRAAKEFGRTMGSEIDRITNVTLGVIDSGIDAFVDAIVAGENALKAATGAIKQTFLELNNEFIKDQFKKIAREGLSKLFPGAGFENLGKSEELIVAEAQLLELKKLNAKTGSGGVLGGGKDTKEEQTSVFDDLGRWIRDTFSSVKETFMNIGKNISSVIGDGIKGITDFISEIDFGSIFDSITSVFSGFSGGSVGSGIGDLASTAISLFFAKGGITGELMNRVPMYANGTVTNGPELAMIGEGPKREAVVPLPDNRSIPVTINGDPNKEQIVNNNIKVTINGIQGTEEGIKRSANQLALRIAREQSRAQGENWIMAFIESPRFPDNISYGSKGGPKFNTVITTVNSGFEFNNINWDQARHSYDVAMGVRDLQELSQLVSFFQIVRGRGHYFRYKDWFDYKSCALDELISSSDQTFGIGDGVTTEFYLLKTYDLSGGIINERFITKPVNGTILIEVNAILLTEDTYTNGISNNDNDYWIDYTSGKVTFNVAPADTTSIKWGGEFDVPCRFDVDQLELSMDFYGHGSTGIPVIEVRV